MLKKKKKGISLVEILIVLACFSIIMAIAYEFLTQSTRTLTASEVRDTLQDEAADIQTILVNNLTQCKNIDNINGIASSTADSKYNNLFSTGNEIDITNLSIEDTDGATYTFELNGKQLKYKKVSSTGVVVSEKIISEHIGSLKVTPLDINLVTDKSIADIGETTGIRFNIILNMKKGFSNINLPLEVIVKFRNKDI